MTKTEDTTPPAGAPFERPVGRMRPKHAAFTQADLVYAYECAADFLDAEEWPEDDGGAQVAAFREAAKRIRQRADTLSRHKPPNAK